jgi:hypothetical protein
VWIIVFAVLGILFMITALYWGMKQRRLK